MAPVAEHFVSDHVLADHFIASQGKENVHTEFELELPKYLALLVEEIDPENLHKMTDDEVAIFKVNSKTSKLEPVIKKEADELSSEDIRKNQDKVAECSQL